MALCVILVTTVFVVYFWLRRQQDVPSPLSALAKPSSGACCVLMGPVGAGKTALLLCLFDMNTVKTCTSSAVNRIDLNEEQYASVAQGKFKTIFDVPGHPRLQHLAEMVLESNKQLHTIVFVVDSQGPALMKQARQVAEQLYTLLTSPLLQGRRQPLNLVLACNKQDLPLAMNKEAVRGQLEQELNSLRQTMAAVQRNDTTDMNEQASSVFLGVEGRSFTFEADLPALNMECRFVECVATSGRGLSSLFHAQ